MNTEVPMGELVVTKEGGNLTASAVGSCLVITLYEPKLKIAGMIHAMLPSRPSYIVHRSSESEVRTTRYEVRTTKYEVRTTKYGTWTPP